MGVFNVVLFVLIQAGTILGGESIMRVFRPAYGQP